MLIQFDEYLNKNIVFDDPNITHKIIVDTETIYEMTLHDVWHYTKPLSNDPSYSIMLIGTR